MFKSHFRQNETEKTINAMKVKSPLGYMEVLRVYLGRKQCAKGIVQTSLLFSSHRMWYYKFPIFTKNLKQIHIHNQISTYCIAQNNTAYIFKIPI